MDGSQEPVLSGLHRILCIMMASDAGSQERRLRDRAPRMTAQLCAMSAEPRQTMRTI
jgi:hypothetical protein